MLANSGHTFSCCPACIRISKPCGVPRNVLSHLKEFRGSKSCSWTKAVHGGRDLVDKDVCVLLKKGYIQGRAIMDLTQEI